MTARKKSHATPPIKCKGMEHFSSYASQKPSDWFLTNLWSKTREQAAPFISASK